MNKNFEEELKKIRYREDRITLDMSVLNDYKRNVLRKITELQGWENVLNIPYKNMYAENAEGLFSNPDITIDVDNKGVMRVYDGKPGYLDTHEILSFNLHNTMEEELRHRRTMIEYWERQCADNTCGGRRQ